MSLIAELKRRNVFRVGVAYAIVGWLLVEVASVVLPTFEAPEWVMKVFTFLVILGFPLTLVIAWAFELTPEGIKRESAVDSDESTTRTKGRKLDFAIIGLLVIAVLFMFVDNYILEAGPEPRGVTTDPVSVPVEPVLTSDLTPREKSIAVLPFANMSGDPEQEFFSDGISEELLNVLAKVKGLQVTSRTSAFAFKGTNTSIPEIAEKLGVKHVLEGSVRMAGDRVRITTQLIEVETDSHLWSESYDRELSDIFAVQDEIAAKVGEALKVALLGADSRPIRTSRETSIEIYSDYLLARQKLANLTVAEWSEAERLLKSVIERDPEYAPAYAALATTYWYMGQLWLLSASEVSERMTPLIERALSLDRNLAEAWQSLASVRWAQGDLEGAQAARDRALELDPQHPQVLTGQILRWIYSHEPERGLVFAEELLRVDPLSPLNLTLMSWVYWRLGLWDDADRMMERIRSINPHNISYLWDAASMANERGDKVTAIELLEKFLPLHPQATDTRGFISQLYFDLGDMEAADFWKKESLKLVPEQIEGWLAEAILHLYHGEEANALAIARKITQRDTSKGLGFEAGLRIVAASDLAAGNHDDVINRNLAYIPELMAGRFPVWKAAAQDVSVTGIFWVALDLASAYLQAGADDKANALLSLVESEFPHWGGWWGYGFADVELHALRGEKEKALAALRVHAETGIGQRWRWQILYNSNLESIRDTPEFAAIVAEIETDMAEQLARIREMQRSGELTAIPELTAE